MEIMNYTEQQRCFILKSLKEKYEMQELRHDVRFKVPFSFKGYDFPVGIRVWVCNKKELYVTAEDYNSSYPQADLDKLDYAKMLHVQSGWHIIYCKTLAGRLSSECWSKYIEVLAEIESLLTECINLHPSDESRLVV